MAFVFGAIPFTDALIVRYVDDRMRSRVAGVRLAIAFGVSSLAVWLLGPAGEGQRLRVPPGPHGRDRGGVPRSPSRGCRKRSAARS